MCTPPCSLVCLLSMYCLRMVSFPFNKKMFPRVTEAWLTKLYLFGLYILAKQHDVLLSVGTVKWVPQSSKRTYPSWNSHCMCVVRTYEIYSVSKFQVCSMLLLTIVTMLCVRVPEPLSDQHLHLPPAPWSLASMILLSVTVTSTIVLDSSYTWVHAVFISLCLTSLSIKSSRSISAVAYGGISSYLMDK